MKLSLKKFIDGLFKKKLTPHQKALIEAYNQGNIIKVENEKKINGSNEE